MLNQTFHINPVLPVWLLIILCLIALALSFKSYWNISTQLEKWALLTFRSISVLILFVLLLNPNFSFIKEKAEKPEIGILIDKSESVLIANGAYKGEQDFKNMLNFLSNLDTTKVGVKYFSFAQDFKTVQSPAQVIANGIETNLFLGITETLNHYPDFSDLILVSDGSYTTGRDPYFAAKTSPYPIHIIALGDTTRVIDLTLSPLTIPKEIQQNANVSVLVSIEAESLLRPEQTTLELFKNGKMISSKKIQLAAGNNRFIDTLTIQSAQQGQDNWEINLKGIQGEFTQKNNRLRFGTLTKNPESQILHLAFGIHPDVKTIRSFVQQIQHLKVHSYTWIGKNRFLEGDFYVNPDSIQAVILQGNVSDLLNSKISESIRKLIQTKPTLFLLNNSKKVEALEAIKEFMPVALNQNLTNTSSTIFKINPAEQNHPILNFSSSVSLESIPISNTIISPIFPKSDTKFLAFGFDSRLQRDYPLIAIRNYKSIRSVQFLFSNFYELHQNGNNQDLFITELISNSLEWLIAPNQESSITLSLPERNISDQEDFPIIVQVKNESGKIVEDVTIQGTLKSKDTVITNFTIPLIGDQSYSTNIGPLTQGLYSVEIQSIKNGEVLAKKEQIISISNTSNEYRFIHRNQQNLKNISQETSGEFVDFSDSKDFIDQIIGDASKKSKLIQVKDTFNLVNHISWYLLLSFMLLAEWLMRKKIALP